MQTRRPAFVRTGAVWFFKGWQTLDMMKQTKKTARVIGKATEKI